MSRARAGALAAWDFVVGDDWRTALGVVVALALTAGLAALGIPAWWAMALAVPLVLTLSLRRAAPRLSARRLPARLRVPGARLAPRFRRRSRRGRA